MIAKQKIITMWTLMIFIETSFKIWQHEIFGFRNTKKKNMTKSDIYFAHTFSNISKRKKIL